jgi:hypothetical protein
MIPSCTRVPRSSLTAQRSTSFPPTTLCQCTWSSVKLSPVGGMLKTSPSYVPLTMTRQATLSHSTIMSISSERPSGAGAYLHSMTCLKPSMPCLCSSVGSG